MPDVETNDPAVEAMSCAAVIVAAGRGLRAGGSVPKQFALIGGITVLRRTVEAFSAHPSIDSVTVVIHPDDTSAVETVLEGLDCAFADGGASRQESVYNGLKNLENFNPDIVLIHDAARPFVTSDVIDASIAGAAQHGAALAGVPVSDTVKLTADDRTVRHTVPRENLWRAQTPQAFRYALISRAHEAAKGQSLTDDAAVAEAAGHSVVMTPGSEDNFKITTAADLERADRLAAMAEPRMATLIGSGFDVHSFTEGDHVTLCGVRIEHSRSLKGHSDADVALHAVTDAILGAIGEGDIGQHFPDTDPQWRGSPSDRFLKHALQLLETQYGHLNNVDLTVICEEPKLQPHRDAMVQSLSALTGLPASRIGLKATTTEKLGFTGRGEGIAAQAVVSVSVPDRS